MLFWKYRSQLLGSLKAETYARIYFLIGFYEFLRSFVSLIITISHLLSNKTLASLYHSHESSRSLAAHFSTYKVNMR